MSGIWDLEFTSPGEDCLPTVGDAGACGKGKGAGVRSHRTELCTQRYQIPRPESPFLSLSSQGKMLRLLAAFFYICKVEISVLSLQGGKEGYLTHGN